ncbi:Homeobox protein knotted-1-like 3 [Vitis vinifera]|uniref:Homeobox protein knotted-1-like 3 n=1 Tax=Vitis vinifera TaxID=29760 RepID=A0A438KEL0_VITVI|nr:Homeobox protein knotted-1-like 3 [Vitis vinifera]
MAFHNQLSQEMALQHFTEQHLRENASVLRTILPDHLSQSSPEGAGKAPENQQQPVQLGTGPTWLNHAIQLRQQSQYSDNNFLNFLRRNTNDVVAAGDEVSNDSIIATAMSHESADLANNNSNNSNVKVNNSGNGAEIAESGDGALLSAHVACLRIATPVDQLPRIDAQLAQSQHVVSKYSALGHGNSQMLGDEKELDQFMMDRVWTNSDDCEEEIVNGSLQALNAAHACGPGPLPMLSFLPSSGALDAAQVFVMVLPGPNVFNPSPNHLLASGHLHPHALGP